MIGLLGLIRPQRGPRWLKESLRGIKVNGMERNFSSLQLCSEGASIFLSEYLTDCLNALIADEVRTKQAQLS